MKKGTVALLSSIGGAIAGVTVKNMINNQKQVDDKAYKFKTYYNMLSQWLLLKQQGKSFEEYFVEKEYKTIAIYGMGEMGERFLEELKGTSIKVKYAIDKNAECIFNDLEVCELDEDLEKVDAIVVTAVFAFEEIEEQIKKVLDFDVISLEDVIFEI